MYELIPGMGVILVLALLGWMESDSHFLLVLALALVAAWASFAGVTWLSRSGWVATVLLLGYLFIYAFLRFL